MMAILNFFQKIAKHKNAYISKTVLDRAISMKVLTHRISLQSSHDNSQKIFVSQKLTAILNLFQKIAKHKNAYISKTMLDRAISMKVLTHRISLQNSHDNFQKNFVSPNISTILNFRIFRKNCKTQNAYISKTVLDRAIATKFFTPRVCLQSSHANFQKKILSRQIWRQFWIFEFFAKIAKTKMLISRKPC